MTLPTSTCLSQQCGVQRLSFRGHCSKGGSQTLLSEGDKTARADDSQNWVSPESLGRGFTLVIWGEGQRSERLGLAAYWASITSDSFCHSVELFIYLLIIFPPYLTPGISHLLFQVLTTPQGTRKQGVPSKTCPGCDRVCSQKPFWEEP